MSRQRKDMGLDAPRIVRPPPSMALLAQKRGLQLTLFDNGSIMLSADFFVRNPMWRVTLWPDAAHRYYEVTLWIAGHAQERPGTRATLGLHEAFDRAEQIFRSRDAAERLGARE